MCVSVSLRSYIHSYENLQLLYSDKENDLFPSPYGVIFILTLNQQMVALFNNLTGFRLLMELYSFLLKRIY